MAEINLSNSIRTTLRSSQQISQLQSRTQERLSTGNKFNSFVDNPRDVAISRSLSNRASDLQGIKNNISQGISKLQSTQSGLETVSQTLNQLKSTALQLENASSPQETTALNNQFNSLSQQLDFVTQDTSFGGTNFISSAPDNATIDFSESSSSAIDIQGQASDSASLGVTTDVATIDAAISQVRSTIQSFGASQATLSIREDFTQELSNQLEAGAAKLVQADLNEEAAISLSAQTRGSLAAAATNIASQSERSILQLF